MMNTADLHPRTAMLLDLAIKRPAHGYVFSGSNVEQMTRTAHELLADIYKSNGASENILAQLRSGKHHSIITIGPIDGTKIKLLQLKTAIAPVDLTARSDETYRMILIESAEKMTIESANSLLKHLEEPNSQLIYVLITSQADQLLPTILSRLQKIDFLSHQTTDQDQPCKYDEQIKQLLAGSVSDKFLVIYQLHSSGDLKEFNHALTTKVHHGARGNPRAYELLDKLLLAEKYIDMNINPRLVLELTALEMSR